VFSFCAIVTSFLGVALSLCHFLADGLKIPEGGWGGVMQLQYDLGVKLPGHTVTNLVIPVQTANTGLAIYPGKIHPLADGARALIPYTLSTPQKWASGVFFE
jgi:hypothetical protein